MKTLRRVLRVPAVRAFLGVAVGLLAIVIAMLMAQLPASGDQLGQDVAMQCLADVQARFRVDSDFSVGGEWGSREGEVATPGQHHLKLGGRELEGGAVVLGDIFGQKRIIELDSSSGYLQEKIPDIWNNSHELLSAYGYWLAELRGQPEEMARGLASWLFRHTRIVVSVDGSESIIDTKVRESLWRVEVHLQPSWLQKYRLFYDSLSVKVTMVIIRDAPGDYHFEIAGWEIGL